MEVSQEPGETCVDLSTFILLHQSPTHTFVQGNRLQGPAGTPAGMAEGQQTLHVAEALQER